MIATEVYLKTQQVADALGVSVSSIKRWVDLGALEATRTTGKHRLVSLASALQFARRENFPVAGLLAFAASNRPVEVDDRLCDRLAEALKDGDDRRATSILVSAYRSSGIVEVADRLVRPVLERIGTGWLLGKWAIYEEHQATTLIASTLAGINSALIQAQEGPRPLALIAALEGDPFTLPGLLAEIVVREAGWDARHLGCDLPLRSLADAARRHRPRLIALSVSQVADRERFLADYPYFYEAANQVGAAVILGGRACDADLRSRLLFASFGDRMAHLAEFARRMLPQAAPPPPLDRP